MYTHTYIHTYRHPHVHRQCSTQNLQVRPCVGAKRVFTIKIQCIGMHTCEFDLGVHLSLCLHICVDNDTHVHASVLAQTQDTG